MSLATLFGKLQEHEMDLQHINQKDLSSMSLATLFGKLQEHEMELQCLNQNEETDKNKRSIALKASISMQEENEEELVLDAYALCRVSTGSSLSVLCPCGLLRNEASLPLSCV